MQLVAQMEHMRTPTARGHGMLREQEWCTMVIVMLNMPTHGAIINRMPWASLAPTRPADRVTMAEATTQAKPIHMRPSGTHGDILW